jgi:hypothetical protein
MLASALAVVLARLLAKSGMTFPQKRPPIRAHMRILLTFLLIPGRRLYLRNMAMMAH